MGKESIAKALGTETKAEAEHRMKTPSEAELIEMEHRMLKLVGQAEKCRCRANDLSKRAQFRDLLRYERDKLEREADAEEAWADNLDRIAEDCAGLLAVIRCWNRLSKAA